MKCLTLAILASAGAMFAVLIVLDLNQIFTTPLSPLGINHWIPEALTLFLIGRWLTRMNRTLLPVIVSCVFLYPILTYALMNQLTFGIGTSSVFVAVLLMGIWSGTKQKDTNA